MEENDLKKMIDLDGKKIDRYGSERDITSNDSYKATPNTLFINVGALCNENCVFCLVKGAEWEMPQMSLDEIKGTIRKFIEAGGEHVVFTGGEPTLRDDLPQIVEYIEQFDRLRSLSIITNGVRLGDPEFLARIIGAMKTNKVSFCFSLHSHKPETSDKLTGLSGTLPKKISAISTILDNNTEVGLYYVITRDNYKELPDFVNFIKDKFPKINVISLAYPFPYGNALKNLDIYVKFSELKQYLLPALELLDKYNYKTNIPSCGQFPLCVIGGFETKLLDSFRFSSENVVGLVGKEVFREFEWKSADWVDKLKNKSEQCADCLLNGFCQGFLSEYITLFGFDGIEPVTEENFKGNKIEHSLISEDDLALLRKWLVYGKINLLILTDFKREYVEAFSKFAKQARVFSLISYSKGKEIFVNE